ncbi:MAG: OB-fold domain-containing protein [Thermoplasmata archaeon]|nr:MAG: OB-fold domain-containing protein [Thermoplasmata archaeon]
MEKAVFAEEGSVLTHTTLYAAPEGFTAPITLALVELDCTARLMCGYKGTDTLNIDDKVRVKTEEDLYFCELLEMEG